MTITEMQIKCNTIAEEHGWNERKIDIPEMIALIHSEASEALESYRRKEPLVYKDPETGSPEGVGAEFADILIRIAHYSEQLGINLELEVSTKMRYNETRPYRHGGKLC